VIGTIGSDETTGSKAGHVDSVSGISDASSDNDLVYLRNCAPPSTSCVVVGFCNEAEGSYGDGGIAYFTSQQIDDTLNFVNNASSAELDACSGITATEAANLAAGAPYSAIGTVGFDETTGAIPGHIDSVSGISDARSDNDFVKLRRCAPVSNSCTNGDTEIKFVSFNIQNLGTSKAGKPAVFDIYVNIALKFDIMLIQELSNVPDRSDNTGPVIRQLLGEINIASANQHSMSVSPRVGDAGAEQYVIIYKHQKLNLIENFVYNDTVNDFEREPYVVRMQAGGENFYIGNIHTKPDFAQSEIYALKDVAHFIDDTDADIIIAGDYNADCSYFNEGSDWSGFELLGEGYFNVIDDSWDTTVGSTICTYDRILISSSLTDDLVSGSGKILLFDDPAQGGWDMNDILTDGCSLGYISCSATYNDAAKKVSDHYPVEMTLRFSNSGGGGVVGCNDGGNYGNGGISSFTGQQVADTLALVNGSTATVLDACTGISTSEASYLANGAPYTAIGTIGADESTGTTPGHIDSVSGISDAGSDNDLVRLRNCAQVTSSCN
jgi:endonuclease/exonuclease/phosphatase family metal-dependent hydrolase